MDIKEIALKVVVDTVNKLYDSTASYSELTEEDKKFYWTFAEAFIAEIVKQNEPVAWMYPNETALSEHETDGPVVKERIPLYTYPPTAEQIAKETAEACARYVNRKRKRLGHFQCEQEAAHAYNKAAIELHGTYARLNPVGVKGEQ